MRRFKFVVLACLGAMSSAFAPLRSSVGKTHSYACHDPVEEASSPPSMLVTFDLDDTLFPIKEVVQEANDAQIRAMHELGYTDATMEECMVQTRAIRQGLTAPITYTDLRKGAIRAELKRLTASGIDVEVLEEQVEHCFEAWLQERHAAAERYLFSDAIAAMEALQEAFGHCNLCIAAITNGRGNPLCMTNTLTPYFSFCVSGEDDDVFPHRKPSPQIYEATLKRWRSQQKESAKEKPDLWIHVGDCLANDVGASYDVGAEPIWVAPLQPESDEQPSWSTATGKDLKERAILMEAAKSKTSGEITSLSQLPSVIENVMKTKWKEGVEENASTAYPADKFS